MCCDLQYDICIDVRRRTGRVRVAVRGACGVVVSGVESCLVFVDMFICAIGSSRDTRPLCALRLSSAYVLSPRSPICVSLSRLRFILSSAAHVQVHEHVALKCVITDSIVYSLHQIGIACDATV